MDVAEKKKEYDALKALSKGISMVSAVPLIIGLVWLRSFNILLILGIFGGFVGTSLQFYARYRFGLIKSFRRWMIIQGIYTVLIISLVIVLIYLDLSG